MGRRERGGIEGVGGAILVVLVSGENTFCDCCCYGTTL